jgi:cephalosporin-C deacetylase-like acetyl esterase
MVHGFAAVKEMTLPTIADHFISNLKLAVLVYDNRGYGASDVGEGQPRNEVIPYDQVSDFSDAISYAQSLSEVDSTKIGIWGSSFSGGHAITVAAGDRRVKAVISQVPFIHGWETVRRLIRADFMGGLEAGNKFSTTMISLPC